jgi:hypothetical protein
MEESEKISNKNSFKVPDKYFEELNERVLSRTIYSDAGSKKRSVNRLFNTVYKIAAILTGVVVISYFAVKYISNETNKNTITGITIEEFIELYPTDIDESVLEENMYKKEPALSIDVNKSEIIEYLQGEDIELSDIYELL